MGCCRAISKMAAEPRPQVARAARTLSPHALYLRSRHPMPTRPLHPYHPLHSPFALNPAGLVFSLWNTMMGSTMLVMPYAFYEAGCETLASSGPAPFAWSDVPASSEPSRPRPNQP